VLDLVLDLHAECRAFFDGEWVLLQCLELTWC
jgi:hypothetical protein